MKLANRDETARKVMVIDSKSFYASCECVDRGLNPLKAMLVVMSQQKNTNGGLVLAASPQAKKQLGIKNVMRQREVPDDPRLIIVQPRMNYYIRMNKIVNDIFREYAAEEDIQLYSIDESIIDVTASWNYLRFRFGDDLTLKKLARIIQKDVKKRTGLYLTVGIGDNPVMAKLALDIEAKHADSLIGEWHYQDIPKKLWPIDGLSRVWSIGKQTEKKLNRLGIISIEDLAYADPYLLKRKLGVRGEELLALAWGIDRSVVSNKYLSREKSLSNSQVLPRDYSGNNDIKVVLREIGEQIASRLRAQRKATEVVSLYIGTALNEPKRGFSAQMTIDATNRSEKIVEALYALFEANYDNQLVRHVGVSAGKLKSDGSEQLDLFVSPQQEIKQSKLDNVIDRVRQKFGNTAIVKLSSLDEGGTMLDRAGLVGGHNGGNAYG